MKKTLFAIVSVLMMVLVSSCAKSKTEIILDEFENLVEEVESKKGKLTADEWVEMEKDFNQRFEAMGIEDFDENEFSAMEKLKLVGLTVRWTAAMAESAPTLMESTMEKIEEEAAKAEQSASE